MIKYTHCIVIFGYFAFISIFVVQTTIQFQQKCFYYFLFLLDVFPQ